MASTLWIMAAVRPRNVAPPVASTVASASPRTTVEPSLGVSPAVIFTGIDSPVSAAWSTSRRTGAPPPGPSAQLTRQSAGTLAPAASSTRSPGTSRVASRWFHAPSRFATARGLSDALSAATALPALLAS